jgi:hypothetical protein
MQAIIIAGGKGTRLKPLTFGCPKPMLPLLQRPFLEWIIDRCKAVGITDILVNVHYQAHQVVNYFGGGDRFGVKNVQVLEGSAPDCLATMKPLPDRVCIEGGRPIKAILKEIWKYLEPEGRVVATASNLESLYLISEGLAELQARNVEVVQAGVNRLETRGLHQTFAAVDPVFILSGEKPL